jgi:hypothetical protein
VDFIDQLKQFSSGITSLREHLKTEEATKHTLILPFLQLLGYNIFNPAEVVPEYTVDVGTKKGEKVDYAIFIKGQPAILIEAKSHDDPLTAYDAQLYRYFSATTAKFAILTNGILYRFYTDLSETNKLDNAPFFEIDLLNIKDAAVAELKKFHKEAFDAESLFSVAASLKYAKRVKEIMGAELKEPDDDFIRFFLKDIYAGKATQRAIDDFKPIIKKALNQYLNDQLSDMLQAAIETTKASERAATEAAVVSEPIAERPQIITTEEELEAFFLVKFLLKDTIDVKRISYKDTTRYLGVLLDGNVTKWICRLYLSQNPKYLALPGKDKAENKIAITSVDDITRYKAELAAAAKIYPTQGE